MARAQDTEIANLKDRMSRLEKMNDKLEQQNERLATQNQELAEQFDRLLKRRADGVRPASANAPQLAGTIEPVQLKSVGDENPAARDEREYQTAVPHRTDGEGKGYQVGSDLNLKTFWKDGFNAETAHKDFRVHFGGRIHADAGWFAPDNELNSLAGPAGWQDGADFRRLRLRTDGTMYEVLQWVLEVDFQSAVSGTTNHPVPTDAYVSLTQLPLVGTLDVGHCKEPFSFDDYGTPDNYLLLMERSIADNAFSPARNMGLLLHNTACDDQVIWATGIFRTNSDNASGNAFDYGDGEYSYTSRVVLMPIYADDGRCWLLFGGAYSHRMADPDDAGTPSLGAAANPSRFRFPSRIPIRVNSPFMVDTGNMIADSDDLYNLQAALVRGPFMLQTEFYDAEVNDIRRGKIAQGQPRLLDGQFDGFYVQLSYLLTGEYHPIDRNFGRLGRVRPRENFFFVHDGEKDCREGYAFGCGAWEVVARYDFLDLNDRVLRAFPAVPGVPNSGAAAAPNAGVEQAITFGLTWYLCPSARFMINYSHGVREVPSASGSQEVDALGVRMSFDF